ncbi:MAG: hypothetical protein GF383_13680 [Candidatus Lokiarchaeota archaeon]|nr:hypothetical protein [Candidatus Lokiarchaeota archaeon]MBD3342305.1 hypothetical protein [Candidatus Lokiarchaeota archaeon]
MTQKKTRDIHDTSYNGEIKKGTRIHEAPPDLYDPNALRLGRRESEPHSAEVTYIYDVLTTNFPEDRTMRDLHHYFLATRGALKGEKIDIQFDISFFRDLEISHTLSSYKASKYNGRIPDLAINILSKSTWRNDISENVDKCKDLGIPVYVVFSPYQVASRFYRPPFLRVYILQDVNTYEQKELRDITLEEEGEINKENIVELQSKLPFSLGIMRLNQKHEEDQSLFRLILINPSTLDIFPTEIEKKLKEKDEKLKEKDQKLKKLETEIKRLKNQIEQK